MGGLPNRSATLNQLRKPANAGDLLLDAGNLFTATKSKKTCKKQKELDKITKLKTDKVSRIIKLYETMSYDAINVSHNDLILFNYFQLENVSLRSLPCTSANIFYKEKNKHVFKPFITKKLGDITIGIFGLTSEPPVNQRENNNYIVKEPIDASRDILNDFRKRVDLIIVLSSLAKESNLKLLKEFPNIDFIISTDRAMHLPVNHGNGYLVSAGDKGKFLGRIDIKLRSLERPLGLQDLGRRARLTSSIKQIDKQAARLEEKKADILQSDNSQIKNQFAQAVKTLQRQRTQYSKEIAQLEKAVNYFSNSSIPLLAKQQGIVRIKRAAKTKPVALAKSQDLPSSEPHIKIDRDQSGGKDTVTFVLSVDKAPNQVRALGFDVVYDPGVLRYTSYIKGGLIDHFDMFDARKLREGLLRVGGFEARSDFIVAGKSGELVRLDFQVIGKGNSDLRLVSLKDDISLWGVKKVHLPSEKNQSRVN